MKNWIKTCKYPFRTKAGRFAFFHDFYDYIEDKNSIEFKLYAPIKQYPEEVVLFTKNLKYTIMEHHIETKYGRWYERARSNWTPRSLYKLEAAQLIFSNQDMQDHDEFWYITFPRMIKEIEENDTRKNN